MSRKNLVILLSLVLLALLQVACTKDLRPSTIDNLTRVTAADQAKGRELLEEAAEVHGVARYNEVSSYQLEAKDEWVGIAGALANPWPESTVNVRLSYRPGSFDGRAEFLEGEQKGTIWGLQSWHTYTETAQGVTFEDNDDARFILPAIQYLTEFPFRSLNNTVAVYAGPEEVGGKTYERVFVTWDNLEPTTEHDQYLAYINPDTGRIEKIFYTVREFMRVATGAIHLDDFREVDGLLIPFRQSITFDVHDNPDDYAHRISIRSVALDGVEPGVFVVDARLGKGQDVKPQGH